MTTAEAKAPWGETYLEVYGDEWAEMTEAARAAIIAHDIEEAARLADEEARQAAEADAEQASWERVQMAVAARAAEIVAARQADGWTLAAEERSQSSHSVYLSFTRADDEYTVRVSDHAQPANLDARHTLPDEDVVVE